MNDLPPGKQRAYGCRFDATLPALEIEFIFIRAGGYLTGINPFPEKVYGLGLFEHFKNAQSLLWPKDDHHRWSDLILKTILEERLTAVCGSRDSSKTRTLSKYVLTDYFAFPQTTLTLMSSTDVRGLELRVWGDLKDLFQRAKDRFEWLPGGVVDSKRGIFTDVLEETGDVRDQRKGCICFVTGTLVDTPEGKKPIESLKPGDKVLNAIGVGIVKRTGERRAKTIVRVTLNDGRTADCTPEHPFFTRRGWVQAIDLNKNDVVVSAYETMRLLSKASWPRKSKQNVLLSVLPMFHAEEKLQAMWEDVSSMAQKKRCQPQGYFLQHGLRITLGSTERKRGHACEYKVPTMRACVKTSSSNPSILFNRLPGSRTGSPLFEMPGKVSITSAVNDETEDEILQRILQTELEQFTNGEEIARHYKVRTNVGEGIPTGEASIQILHRKKTQTEHSSPIHHGPGISRHPVECGTGWGNSQNSIETEARRQANNRIETARVDSCQILKQESDERFAAGKGGYTVHNLEVSGHPSYSVNGMIVHNCVPILDSEGNETKALEKFVGAKQERRRLIADEVQFLSVSYLRILSNLDKGNFKSVFMGNPLGQKALDKVAEPECGWSNQAEPTKTATWRNKFGGLTINLVGTDSPNFDEDRPKHYPYLIDAEDVERVSKMFGPDSIEFYSQIKGVRKSGINTRIVLTPEMCQTNGAFNECIWGHSEITNVLGIDAGYGGDACETILIQFGLDSQNNNVIKFHEPEIIPININDPMTPEDQIAIQTRRMCEIKRVPFSNVFFEAGMRATLAISLARVLSNAVNAVNAGGPATTRPVCNDLYVDDDNDSIGRKRLKRCDEHYSKFITEMWFTVRLLVECRQARELPKSVVKEFSEREWIWAKGNRYELETKEDFKQRCNYSPNKADSAAIGVEGARRLGFVIERTKEARQAFDVNDDWLEQELQKFRSAERKRELAYG